MMGIEDLDDREKSVLLAQAMGWVVRHIPEVSTGGDWSRGYYEFADSGGARVPLRVLWEQGAGWNSQPYKTLPTLRDFSVLNLYTSQNVALAWRVLSWGLTAREPGSIHARDAAHNRLRRARFHLYHDHRCGLVGLMSLPIADAQRAWLDKVLVLAIETGLITLLKKEKKNEKATTI